MFLLRNGSESSIGYNDKSKKRVFFFNERWSLKSIDMVLLF